MISIDRLEEMAIEELETKLNNWKEQVELQSNFIESLLKATNNSEWLNKTILDDEASEIIEKIELDYIQLDQLKTENEELKKQNNQFDNGINEQFSKIIELEGRNNFLKQILTEIKEIAEKIEDECEYLCFGSCANEAKEQILQKISECEGNDEIHSK